ncbi:MAG TPA: EAL domain-containing response regulator [Dongiaceae bacterium]|nr:EAL domain-containing response regulator [Dongiaceae bacterium]
MIYLPAGNASPDADLHPAIFSQGVLVVDDSGTQRANIRACLQQFGIQRVHEAADGSSALHCFRHSSTPPAVVVLDLELPGMDGIEVLQRLGEERHRPAIIVASAADEVLISAVATMVEALGVPLLGAFRKPVPAAALRAALASFGRFDNGPLHGAAPITEIDPLELRQAIQAGQIQPFYQPKISLQQGTLAGLEALARWTDSQGRSIPPSRFIALAEQHGLIGELTLALLRQVLRDMGSWQQRGVQPPVAINLSATSLVDRNLAGDIIQQVQAMAVSSRQVTFEITESALVADLASALATISRLRLKGFGFSIDDYGTGFSSMQQLSRFPFTELKIDRTFVHGAPQREQLRTILQSAIDMGRRLGITTVAEGVETEAELHLLKAMGCRQAQGYLIARPMPAQQVADWIPQHANAIAQLCQPPFTTPS